SNQSYHSLVRQFGRQAIWNNPREYGRIVYRPVDRRENFIKRCIGLPGDTVEIRHNWVYVNGLPQDSLNGMQFDYQVITDGTPINQKKLDMLEIYRGEYQFSNGVYILPLTEESRREVYKLPNVRFAERMEIPAGERDGTFPFSRNYNWNRDNYGPVWIPKKGMTVPITIENLPLYERIIDVYESNDLEVSGNIIKINGQPTGEYTFKMDYYWMMGDNRHNSADSRYWGFVPEDHIVGRPVFVYVSFNKNKKFPANIRWNRILMKIR
ncbi:MAG: signal peptidase I, partial [Bacteroidales bacterium]